MKDVLSGGDGVTTEGLALKVQDKHYYYLIIYFVEITVPKLIDAEVEFRIKFESFF